MPKICYQARSFSAVSRDLIDRANEIIAEYEAQDFDLTLRQLYYQMVARNIIANRQQEYKRLGSIINDARLAGLIDWDRINDLTRELRAVSHWDSPADIISSAARSFHIDKWADQDERVEVWVEKDALRNVVERACTALDVAYFACRGYVSQSEMWAAAQRFIRYDENGQPPLIIHLGDHDPSGIDMTRDIADRLAMFGANVGVDRIALNMDQIEEYAPPPNPAKTTDSRFNGYIRLYGEESWELDALDPATLNTLITNAVQAHRNDTRWRAAVRLENGYRADLQQAANRWDEVAEYLRGDE